MKFLILSFLISISAQAGRELECGSTLSEHRFNLYLPRDESLFGIDPRELEKISKASLFKYQIHIDESGLIRQSDGRLLTTDTWFGKSRKAIYVMDSQGNIYFSTWKKFGYFHHTSFDLGAVAAAGEIRIVKGKIVYIHNRSGHYLPSPKSIDQVLRILELHGIDYPIKIGYFY